MVGFYMQEPEPTPRVVGAVTGDALRKGELVVRRKDTALSLPQLRELSLDELADCEITLKGARMGFGRSGGRYSAGWNDLSASCNNKEGPLDVLDSMYDISACYDPDGGWTW